MRIITLSGASGSGKTTVAKFIHEQNENSILLSLDNYYLNSDEQFKKNGFVDFDHPKSLDSELLKKNIDELKKLGRTKIPKYCFEKRDRVGYEETIVKDLLIVEGLYASYFILNESKINVFINVDLDIALLRRIHRDIAERNRTIESITEQYLKYVRPAYLEYIQGMKSISDLVITNNTSLEVLTEKIEKLLLKI